MWAYVWVPPGSYEVTDKARQPDSQTCETGSSAAQHDNSLVRCSVPGEETGASQLGNGEPGE